MWETLINAATNLIGGNMKQNAQENANAMNQANWQTQMAYTDLVNKNQIQWKVADAKAAGLHPLAALGASTATGPTSAIGAIPETGGGEGVAAAGQDISRAMNASRSQQQRAQAFDETMRSLQLESLSLRNDLTRSQIARLNQSQNPPVPSFDERWQGAPGQGQAVKMKPWEFTPGQEGKPWMEPGAITDVGHARTRDGYAVVPSKEMQERIEDNFLASMSWMMRNQIMPSLGFSNMEKPPAAAPPEGYEWRWHPFYQEYRPARRRGIFKEWK